MAMFHLDQAIAEWRRQMIARGIKAPVPLDELENHLREDIDGQMRSHGDPDRAFASAVRRIGEAGHLKKEFEKVQEPTKDPRRKLLRIISVFWGVSFVYIAVFSTWIIASREGAIKIIRLDALLALGSLAAMISFGLVGRNVAKLLPPIIGEWRQSAALVAVSFPGVLLITLVWRHDWNSLVHLQLVSLWTMSPLLGFLHCLWAWCEKCEAARRQISAMNA